MTTPNVPMPEGEEAPPRGVRAMAIIRWLILGGVTIAAAVTVGGFFFPGKSETVAHPRHDAGEVATRYVCPMHPQVVSDKPGQCPICNMDLVPMTSDSAGSTGAEAFGAHSQMPPGLVPVTVAEERLQTIGVRIEEARREPLARELRFLGRVTADPSRVVNLHVRVSGYVEKLYVADPGAPVVRGQPLAAVYSDELLRLQQELLQAKGWNTAGIAPIRDRLRLLGVTDEEIAAIEAAGTPQRAIVVRSPATGYATAVNTRQGDRVDPSTELFEVSDLSRLWVLADVYERDLSAVHKGDEAKLTLDAYPSETFTGKVEYIYPTLNVQTRTLPIRITFANPQGKLKPGFFGQVRLAAQPVSALTVSAEAIINTGQHQYVFVQARPGRFEPREVTVGTPSGNRVAVLTGLSEGERVASSGNFFIDAESRLRASVGGSANPAGASSPSAGAGPNCETDFDAKVAPDKYAQCRRCEQVHRGMGSMEVDCKNSIPKPWRSP